MYCHIFHLDFSLLSSLSFKLASDFSVVFRRSRRRACRAFEEAFFKMMRYVEAIAYL